MSVLNVFEQSPGPTIELELPSPTAAMSCNGRLSETSIWVASTIDSTCRTKKLIHAIMQLVHTWTIESLLLISSRFSSSSPMPSAPRTVSVLPGASPLPGGRSPRPAPRRRPWPGPPRSARASPRRWRQSPARCRRSSPRQVEKEGWHRRAGRKVKRSG